jgi:hypothetical protein
MLQNYSPLPWLSLSVNENIKLAAKIQHYVEMVKLGHADERKPHELSAACASAPPLPAPFRSTPKSYYGTNLSPPLMRSPHSELQDQILNIWDATAAPSS